MKRVNFDSKCCCYLLFCLLYLIMMESVGLPSGWLFNSKTLEYFGHLQRGGTGSAVFWGASQPPQSVNLKSCSRDQSSSGYGRMALNCSVWFQSSTQTFFSNYLRLLSFWQKRRNKLVFDQAEVMNPWVPVRPLRASFHNNQPLQRVTSFFMLFSAFQSHLSSWVMSSSFHRGCLSLLSSTPPILGMK